MGTPSKTKSSTHFDLGLCRGTPTAVSKFSFFYISSVMWVRWVPFKIIVSRQYQSVSLGSFTVGQRIHVFSAPRETNLNFWSNLFLICLFNCHSCPNRKAFSWHPAATQPICQFQIERGGGPKKSRNTKNHSIQKNQGGGIFFNLDVLTNIRSRNFLGEGGG